VRGRLRPRGLALLWHFESLKTNTNTKTTRARAPASHALRFQQELPLLHDLLPIHPDMNFLPTTSMCVAEYQSAPVWKSIGVAERDVNAGILFVLENLPNHIFEADVRADGELNPHDRYSRRCVCYFQKSSSSSWFFRVSFGQAVALDLDRQGRALRSPNFSQR